MNLHASIGIIAMLQQQRGSMLPFMIQLVAIIAIMYFLLIRPQQMARRRHAEMLAALKKGDEVMTEGGIIGQIVHITEDRLTLRTGENTRIIVARPKIARVFTAPEPEKA